MGIKNSILIIDDNKDVCLMLKQIFVLNDFEVDTAMTGQEAIEKVRGRFFDVSLLDIKLPDIEGTKLIPLLKKIHPNIKIIIVSGFSYLNTSMKILDKWGLSYVVKPFDIDELLFKIKEAIEKQCLIIDDRKISEKVLVGGKQTGGHQQNE
ncbi:MAG: response regulator [bacterium]|nr:response regulator [bacterium]